MRSTVLSLVLLISIAVVHAQKKVKVKGDKNVIDKTYILTSFDTVEIYDDLEITFTAGNLSNTYFLRADANLHDLVKFEVVDSILKISTSARITSSKKMDITLNVSTIHALKLYNNAQIKQLGSLVSKEGFEIVGKDDSKMKLNINAKNINFSLSNDADADVDLQAESIKMIFSEKVDAKAIVKADFLDLQMYKDAELSASGDVENLRMSLVGKPILRAEKLMVRNADVKQDNGSEATLNCSKEIAVFLEGKSKLYLYNSPNVIMNGIKGK